MNMKRKPKGSATGAAILFIASGTLAAALGFRQFDHFSSETVWVTNTTLNVGQVITQEVLTTENVTKDRAKGAIKDPKSIIGKKLKVSKKKGQLISAADVKTATRPSLSHHVPAGWVVYSLTPKSGTIPYSQLNSGDRLDILVRGRLGVRTAARDVRLIGLLNPRGSNSGKQPSSALLKSLAGPSSAKNEATTLVLAVRPDAVYPLASIGDLEATTVVLHSAHDTQDGSIPTIGPSKRYHEVEIVSGLKRNKVKITL